MRPLVKEIHVTGSARTHNAIVFGDGPEVLEWIRHQAAFYTLPVIVFSASNRELDVHKAYALCANAYLVKPSG